MVDRHTTKQASQLSSGCWIISPDFRCIGCKPSPIWVFGIDASFNLWTSLSKINWILHTISALWFVIAPPPCTPWPQGFWVSKMSNCSVPWERWSRGQWNSQLCQFFLLAELLEAESVTSIVSHDEPRTDRMSSCEWNLTHLCALAPHRRESLRQNQCSWNSCHE